MKEYITKFDKESEYTAYILEENYIRPNVSYCRDVNRVFYDPFVDYFTIEALENGTIEITKGDKNLSYSMNNGKTWITLLFDANINVEQGDKILFKGKNTSCHGLNFGGSDDVNISGNIMSLIDEDNFNDSFTLSESLIFRGLFEGWTGLKSAENLILLATTLSLSCYEMMFKDCTQLTKTPKLPVTDLSNAYGCYRMMFNGCTALTTAPTLPATTLVNSCYESMFKNCTSLTTVPELPARRVFNYCYYSMFEGCTSLIVAPDLPATNVGSSCYENMFKNCTSLTTIPTILPANYITYNCYAGMFDGCTLLTTAPILPALNLYSGCYNYMFRNCTNLNYIKAMFTTSPSNSYTRDWVNGVAASGTFVKNSAATWTTTGNNGVPTGWTTLSEDLYVDLGLPSGTKWAKMNVNASGITGYGSYYMYGKRSTDEYKSSDNPYTGTANPLSSYYDTATSAWNTPWHMPTRTQCEELINNTTYQWVENYQNSGVNGATFTANGQTLFIPAAGTYDSGILMDEGEEFRIYTSTPNGANDAYCLSGTSEEDEPGVWSYTSRTNGNSIRPVKDS